MRFVPIVYSTQGGAEPEASKALDQIHRLVAAVQHEPLNDVRRRFDIELSILIQKANFRAFARRHVSSNHAAAASSATVRAVEAALLLEAP